MQKRRIEGLDFFRGAAAIAVVLFHSWRYLDISWLAFAFVAVDLFFVLSGIVLAMRYTDAIMDGMPFVEFASARLQRLYPMVVIAGVLVAALNLLKVPSGFLSVSAGNDSAWRIFAIWPASLEASKVDAFPSDGPMWSLWAELAVNALWYPIVRYRPRWMGAIGALAMLGLMAMTFHMQSLDWGAGSGIENRLLSLLRAAAWFSVGYWIGRSKGQRAMPVVIALPIFLGIIAAFSLTRHGGFHTHLIIIAAGCVLLHSLYHEAGVWQPLRGVSRMLGILSYPLYLIHAPAGRLLPPSGNLVEHWLMLLGCLGGAAVIAAVINEWLVRRIHLFVRWRRERAVTVPSPLPTPSRQ